MPPLVDEHVVRSEFAVDEAVVRPRRDGGGEGAEGFVQPRAGVRQPRHALRGAGELAQRPVEHDLLAPALVRGAGRA